MKYTFDDVLIVPKMSYIKSRKDVDLSTELGPFQLTLPVISSNMDTVTGPHMAKAMWKYGGLGVLHRFSEPQTSKADYQMATSSGESCGVSVGLGSEELDKASMFYDAGARVFFLDVAHGAQSSVVDQYMRLKDRHKDIFIVVGNFATHDSVGDFIESCGYRHMSHFEGGIKVGIGPGSACTTRIKTGCGYPQLSAIQDVCKLDFQGRVPIIADGGMRTSGDIAKALAAGAHMVMLGGMLAGTEETPLVVSFVPPRDWCKKTALERDGVKYRGSASQESYDVQGKDSGWRTAEGESFHVKYKGHVDHILKDIEGGLRSAFTYVGASNLREFHRRAEFIQISSNTVRENGAHGRD